MYIDYPQGGELAESLVGRAHEISIVADSTTLGMEDLIAHLNENLRSTLSNAIITDVRLNYQAILSGNKDSAVIEYKMEIIPTITNHILQRQNDKSTIDASWRGIKVAQPIIIDTQYGKFDINNPRSALDVLIPKESGKIIQLDIVKMPLIDASKILDLPLDKWHSLFDNTVIIPGAKEFNFTGKYVVTHYSMGECNIEVGNTCQDREWFEDFELDKRYTIRAMSHRMMQPLQLKDMWTIQD